MTHLKPDRLKSNCYIRWLSDLWWPVSISGLAVSTKSELASERCRCVTSLSIDLLIHHTLIINDHQNYVNTLSKMILHIEARIYAFS